MKQKILVLTLCFIFLLNSVSFANNKNDIQTIQQENYIRSRTVYNEKTGENEIVLTDVNGKSAVAVTTSVASALLAIATKAGISFVDAGSMDKFLYHFLSLDNATEIVGALGGLIKNTTTGVITLSRSLIDTITRSIAQSYYKRLQILQFSPGYTIPVVGEFSGGSYVANSTLLKQSIINAPSSVSVTAKTGEVPNEIIIPSPNANIKITKSASYSYSIGFFSAWKNSTNTDFSGYDIGLSGKPHYYADYWKATILAFWSESMKQHYLVGALMSWNEGASSMSDYTVSMVRLSTWDTYYLTYELCTDLILQAPSIPSFPDAWSGTISGNDGTTSSSVSIPLPSDTNDLIGKDSTSVDVTTPGYDVWTPGTSVAPPATDNPSVGYEDVVTKPPTDTEEPDEKPDSGGTSWDWLNNLIQAIIGLLNNIWEWITGFWDMLTKILSSALSGIVDVLTNIWNWVKEFWNTFTKTLGDILSSVFSKLFNFFDTFWETLSEFIEGLFVPKETYWTDKVTEVNKTINNKYPTVNIDKLEELAVGEKKFEDIYATFFGQKCLVVRASLVNNIIGWARPIIQGLLCIFLLLYNYNNLYKLLRNGTLTSPSESSHKK